MRQEKEPEGVTSVQWHKQRGDALMCTHKIRMPTTKYATPQKEFGKHVAKIWADSGGICNSIAEPPGQEAVISMSERARAVRPRGVQGMRSVMHGRTSR
jgi:hypothetical protein